LDLEYLAPAFPAAMSSHFSWFAFGVCRFGALVMVKPPSAKEISRHSICCSRFWHKTIVAAKDD